MGCLKNHFVKMAQMEKNSFYFFMVFQEKFVCISLKENVRNKEKFYEKVEIYGIVYVKFFLLCQQRKVKQKIGENSSTDKKYREYVTF